MCLAGKKITIRKKKEKPLQTLNDGVVRRMPHFSIYGNKRNVKQGSQGNHLTSESKRLFKTMQIKYRTQFDKIRKVYFLYIPGFIFF